MEVQQLRYVCAIAEANSFSGAAARCRVAQPSLSQQVRKLEDELGARLFDRLGRRIRLTDAGRAFLPHAHSILHELEAARSSVSTPEGEVRGSVAVGAIPTVAPYLLPRCTAAFAAGYPLARLRVVEATTPALIEGLRNLSLDIAILALPLSHRDMEWAALCTEPLFAVLPKGHPRAGDKLLSLRDLRGQAFVMLRDGHCFRDLSLAACAHARLKPRIAFESDQFSSLLGMVAAGVGVSLVPHMAVDPRAGCCYIRLRDPHASRTIVTAALRGRRPSRVQQAFLACIRRDGAA